MSIAGVQHHFGCFDEEDAAGRRADEASRLLGAHEKCNFDKYGFETGYDGSAVGHWQANLMPGGSSSGVGEEHWQEERDLRRPAERRSCSTPV